MAIENLDFAWSIMDPVPRAKVTRPSDQIQQKVEREIPTEEEMLRWNMYRRMSSRTRDRERRSRAEEIGKEMVIQISTQIIDALKEVGQLIREVKELRGLKDFPESIV